MALGVMNIAHLLPLEGNRGVILEECREGGILVHLDAVIKTVTHILTGIRNLESVMANQGAHGKVPSKMGF
jgi:hypothetical protein